MYCLDQVEIISCSRLEWPKSTRFSWKTGGCTLPPLLHAIIFLLSGLRPFHVDAVRYLVPGMLFLLRGWEEWNEQEKERKKGPADHS